MALEEEQTEIERLRAVVAQVNSLAKGIIRRNQGGNIRDTDDVWSIVRLTMHDAIVSSEIQAVRGYLDRHANSGA